LSWILLSLAGVLSCAYTWIGCLAFWFVGQVPMHTRDYLLLYQPFLALPIVLVSIVSLRIGATMQWAYLLGTYLLYLMVGWPRISTTIFSSKADWLLIGSAILIQMAFVVENRRVIHPISGRS
jgi:hypothetical protein